MLLAAMEKANLRHLKGQRAWSSTDLRRVGNHVMVLHIGKVAASWEKKNELRVSTGERQIGELD